MEKYLGVAAFVLPSTVAMFAVAWVVSLLFPRPRAEWRHGILALFGAWIGTVLLAPLFSQSPSDFMATGPFMLLPFVLSAVLLFLIPRLAWRRE